MSFVTKSCDVRENLFHAKDKHVPHQNYHILNNIQIGDGNNFGGSHRVNLVVAFTLKFWENDRDLQIISCQFLVQFE